jgi:hypothetical protein
MATLWKEHIILVAEQAKQIALAEQAASELKQFEKKGERDEAKLAPMRGREIEARMRALAADNKHDADKWHDEQKKLDKSLPLADPWVKKVTVSAALADARTNAATKGTDFGKALQTSASSPGTAKLQKEYLVALHAMTLAELRVDEAAVEFEISKRADIPNDADLPALKKQLEQIQDRIKKLEASKPAP